MEIALSSINSVMSLATFLYSPLIRPSVSADVSTISTALHRFFTASSASDASDANNSGYFSPSLFWKKSYTNSAGIVCSLLISVVNLNAWPYLAFNSW